MRDLRLHRVAIGQLIADDEFLAEKQKAIGRGPGKLHVTAGDEAIAMDQLGRFIEAELLGLFEETTPAGVTVQAMIALAPCRGCGSTAG